MNQKPLRLLVPDGDLGWGEALQTVLGSHGLTLHPCSRDGEAQDALLDEPSVDLIVVDLDMASSRCQRLVQWLQLQHRHPPVLAVGAGLPESRRVKLLESWADDVLPLPLAVPEFVARCRALWRRHQLRLAQVRQHQPQTLLRHGPLELWVEEHRVSNDGVPVTLTPLEFRLLEHLLRHPGQVHDRSTLLEQVWGPCCSLERDPKTVDVHIRWLRTKLERDPATPRLILTARGQGYRLG